MKRADRVRDLFDFMVLTPQGATIDEMADHLDWKRDKVRDTIRDLRHFLGDNDVVNMTCNPNGANKQWLYTLVTGMEPNHEWFANRTGDAEARTQTILSMVNSVVRATSPRTLEGKRARLFKKHLTRLLEDLRELGQDTA